MRETIDTTYADLRTSDLIIDKSGKAWPVTEFAFDSDEVTFWLCDPVTKVRMHLLGKPLDDAVKVSRLLIQADEASKLEADFPDRPQAEALYARAEEKHTDTLAKLDEFAEYQPHFFDPSPNDSSWCETCNMHEMDHDADQAKPHPTMAEAVAAVEEIGGTVEAEVTAAEVDAAAAATDDSPLTLPPFADMTPLEQRSHLYLLHGLYGSDVTGKAELIKIHFDAEIGHDAGTLNSRHVPHAHEVAS